MRVGHLATIVPIVCCLLAGNESFGNTQVQLSMDVSASHPTSDKYVFHVKVTNTQNVSISVDNVHLPWYTPNEFVLIPRGVRLDSLKSSMPRGGPTSDYMDITYKLAPGESLEGDVTLHNMFPTFISDVENFGVIIEWSCKAKKILLDCKGVSGGSFLIPKGGGKPIEQSRTSSKWEEKGVRNH